VEIIEKTNEKIINFHRGEARIKNGCFKIIHNTNLENLSKLTLRIEATAEKCLHDHPIIYNIIKNRCNQVTESLQLLAPTVKRKRAIAWIGSAWKWIAGNPDENDFATMTDHINGIVSNNNQQTVINKDFQDRINKLTEKYNQWKDDKSSIDDSKLFLVEELDQLQRTVDNIFAAIHLAKKDIINQASLDAATLQQATSWAKANNLESPSLAQILDYAEIAIGHTNNSVITILKFPTLEEEIFKYSTIRPVIHNKLAISTDIEEVIANHNHIFKVTKACNQHNGIFVCDRKHLTDIAEDGCIANILNQKNASCNYYSTFARNDVEEVADGIVLLNNFNGTINSSCTQPRMVSGTFVVKIKNCSITIGNLLYQNCIEPTLVIDESKFHQNPVLNKIENRMTFEYLEELHINNTKHLIWYFFIWYFCSKTATRIATPVPATSPAPVFFTYKQRGRASD
jgi:hypothetical protein